MSVKDVTYTPLTKSQARILVEAFNKEILILRPTVPNNADIISIMVILNKNG